MPTPPNNETRTLLHHATSLQTLLRSFASPSSPPTDPAHAPLTILSKSSTLLKAHTTKLSLLLLNDPFTPSALTSVLADLENSCIPALIHAARSCNADAHGATLTHEVQRRASATLREVDGMIAELALRTHELASLPSSADENENETTPPHPPAGPTTTSRPSRDQLTTTGKIFSHADALAALAHASLPGLLMRQAEQQRATLADAIAELKEWRDEAEDEGFEDDDDSARGLAVSDEEGDGLEQLLCTADKLPTGRADLRATVERGIGKLRMVESLVVGLMRRRFGALPRIGVEGEEGGGVGRGDLARIDEVMTRVGRLPEMADEFAGRLYELDDRGAREMIARIVEGGRGVVGQSRVGWVGDGREDEFTAWADRWDALIQTG